MTTRDQIYQLRIVFAAPATEKFQHRLVIGNSLSIRTAIRHGINIIDHPKNPAFEWDIPALLAQRILCCRKAFKVGAGAVLTIASRCLR